MENNMLTFQQNKNNVTEKENTRKITGCEHVGKNI